MTKLQTVAKVSVGAGPDVARGTDVLGDLSKNQMKAMRTAVRRYVAFLRGINLGYRRVQMSRLKVLFEQLGFRDVETFIASGNVLFSTGVADTSRLEARIAGHLGTALGYTVDTFVRTVDEVAAIARLKVFPEDGQVGVTIHVGLFHEALPTIVARQFENVRTPVDEFHVLGREVYWLCRVRTSESKVWTLPELKALRLPSVTMRNVSSIRKLVAKHAATRIGHS